MAPGNAEQVRVRGSVSFGNRLFPDCPAAGKPVQIGYADHPDIVIRQARLGYLQGPMNIGRNCIIVSRRQVTFAG